MPGDGLVGRPPLLDGHGHGAPGCSLGVGLAAGVTVEIREGREARGEVRPLLDALAVCRALLEEADAFLHAPKEAIGVPEAHGVDADPVVDVVLATRLERWLED